MRSNDASSSSNAAEILERFLEKCEALDASDLHLSTNEPPCFRVHGPLVPGEIEETLTREQLKMLAARLLEDGLAKHFEESGNVDGAISSRSGARFRYNVYRQGGEIAIALRRLEDRFRRLSELGMNERLYELCDLPDGLVVVAGPTGAGKSTTLASLLHRINETRPCHVITIEDPVEYIHHPIRAVVHQRQVGRDALSFDAALVAALRQDPDVILVGEIRDLATIRTAITAAETGHLVFTTVHAGDCVSSIERLVAVFPADEQEGVRRQLSLVLRAVITQRLVVMDGEAARKLADSPKAARRAVVSETLMITPAVANLISSGKSSQIYSAIESGAAQGMQTLEQDLARLVLSRQISDVRARGLARQPQVLMDIISTRTRALVGLR